MLVSAVLDPSAFNAAHFNPAQGQLYKIQAEDFLKGIQKNGVLVVDPENKLRDALIKEVESIPTKYRQQLEILVTHLFQNEKGKRVIACSVSGKNIAAMSLLDLAYHLKTNTEADALIVADDNYLRLSDVADLELGPDFVLLSEYRDSHFEVVREKYEIHDTRIDKLPESKRKDYIIRSIRFSKYLRFYDPYIGIGDRTRAFQQGIKYILSLWHQHGFFASQRDIGSVQIFTRRDLQGKTTVQKQRHKIMQELIKPLSHTLPWPIKFIIKDDPNGIFHARYLETQHAVVRADRGFDFFKSGKFRRNLVTLNMVESSQLREYRKLPDAPL